MVWDLGDFDLLSCFWCLPLGSAQGNVNAEGMLKRRLVCLAWHAALNSL